MNAPMDTFAKRVAFPMVKSAIALVSMTAHGHALAQAGPASLEDIVVTARKKAESLVNVPVAVSALGEADIARYNASDLGKISQLAPQVIVTRGQSGGGANILIRGLGSGSGDQALEQTVSINVDGVQVGRGRILSIGMFDLQQVEVLKGPQALYFGKNSPAGVISLTSAAPTDTLSGYVRAGYEFVADERYIEAAISGPVTDTLKARLAVRGRYMKGWLHNTAQPAPNPADPAFPASGAYRSRDPRTEDILGRLTLEYEPTSDTTVTLRVLGGRSDEGGLVSTGQGICFAPSTTMTTGGFPNPGSDCTLNRNVEVGGLLTGFPTNGWRGIRDGGKPYQVSKVFMPMLTINQDLGDLDLTSVTGYFDLDVKAAGNVGYASLGLAYSTFAEHTRMFSQELRLNSDYDGPLNFTLGGYYSHNKMDGYTAAAQIFRPTLPDPATGRSYSFDRQTNATGETLSAFGQIRWNPVEQLELAGGVRYTHEKKSASTGNTYVHPNFAALFSPGGIFLGNKRSENNWSPELTATFHPVAGQTLYAAYKTGYKSGGISQPSVVTRGFTATNLLFRPERIKGFEAGYKAELLDRTLRFDLTLYNYKVTDLQVVALLSSTTSSFLTNAGSARTKGVESSINWRASDQLTLRGSVGYNRARYLTFDNSPCYLGQTAAQGCVNARQDLTGRPLTRAPEWSAMGGFTFTQPIGDLELGIDGDINHSSGFYTQDNQHPLSYQKAYQLLNAGVRLGHPGMGWELAFIGRNLTNKYYRIVQVDATVGGINQFGVFSTRPRELAIQGTYRF